MTKYSGSNKTKVEEGLPEAPEELQDLIRQIQLLFSVFYGVNLSKWEVTLRQFSVLVALVRAKQLKMSELAKALHVSLPAMTQMVDQLERKKLVCRGPHPTDRRVTLIEMTPAGKQVASQTQGRALKLISGIMLRFPMQERKTVAKFMRAMSHGLFKAVEESGEEK